jgi:hypothetical protein
LNTANRPFGITISVSAANQLTLTGDITHGHTDQRLVTAQALRGGEWKVVFYVG